MNRPSLAFLLILVVSASASAVDFQRDIMPVLTKAGCNGGACHGAAVGRGEFRLSLYGGDPQADFQAIVRELQGRRVNLADPGQSLLILKATETIEHGGGQRLGADEEGANRLLAWIEQGARWSEHQDGGDASPSDLQRLAVSPQRGVVTLESPQVQLSATAHFADGSQRDVTRWTVFTPEDTSSVSVDATSGEATVLRRGRHVLVARYLGEVTPIEILVPLSDHPAGPAVSDSLGWIDRQVIQRLSTLRIPLSPSVDDATFLRRVTLDLTGRLPTPAATRGFLADERSDRRERLIDRLLESDEFNEYWTSRLAQLLRLKSQANDDLGASTYHRWLREQLEQRVGYDRLAREVLTAQGDTHEIGPANFYRTVGGPREQAELTSEVFMGQRLRCANCHNHPLDRWTQDDYHGMSAIFATVRSGRTISLDERGFVIHPKTGENAVPKIPGERFLDADTQVLGTETGANADLREDLAAWLIDSDNPYFAKAIVNRLWQAMMGRGLVEPVDDLRATNPATHPALLDQLADDFVDSGYDLRHTLGLIARSDAYARSADAVEGNESDDRFYSRFLRTPLPPEVLADAISDVLELPETYGDLPLGTRAVALVDPKTESRSLDILGRCSREDTCESAPGSGAGGLTLKLHLFNGDLLNRRIAAPQSRLSRLLRESKPPMQVIDEFYTTALQRHPSEAESAFWREQIGDGSGTREVLEDFVWSLLTCNEFTTNH